MLPIAQQQTMSVGWAQRLTTACTTMVGVHNFTASHAAAKSGGVPQQDRPACSALAAHCTPQKENPCLPADAQAHLCQTSCLHHHTVHSACLLAAAAMCAGCPAAEPIIDAVMPPVHCTLLTE